MTSPDTPTRSSTGRPLGLSLAFAALLVALRAVLLAPLFGAGGCTPAPIVDEARSDAGWPAGWIDAAPSTGPDAASEPGSDAGAAGEPDCDVPNGDTPPRDPATPGDPDPGPGPAPDALTDAPGSDTSSSPDGGGFGGPDCPEAGALVITEVMVDPVIVDDARGEYVEVFNLTNATFDLRGWELVSGAKRHRIADPSPVVIRPRGVVVLAADGDPVGNGGFFADHAWSGLKLGNSAGDFALRCGDLVVDHVAWSETAWPLKPGRALVLDPAFTDAGDNDDPAHWCAATLPFGSGDQGSPGQPETACAPGACSDGILQAWEACDDGNGLSGDGCSRDCRPESFAPGAVVISEFHYAPIAAGSAGEFIELHNPGIAPIDIAGWTLSDDRNDRVRILPDSGVLEIPARSSVVLARSADPARNGGLSPHWTYGDRFVLNAPEDRIVLSWNGVEIDRVDYRIGNDDWPEGRGRSLALDGTCIDHELNDCGAFWCPTPPHMTLSGGDAATPGAPNQPCP
jgi:cysteine-rich repeat protein